MYEQVNFYVEWLKLIERMLANNEFESYNDYLSELSYIMWSARQSDIYLLED